MFKFKKVLTPLLIILLLFSVVVTGAPTYVYIGTTTDFNGDAGVPSGKGYYINDVLFSTTGLIDISTLAKTDGNFIVGDGSNWVVESDSTARTSLGLGNVENLKVKLDATQAPTVNNDVDEGYAVGSNWLDITNDKGYVCLDNTDGAAVWMEITFRSLLSATTVAFNADADTTLYTVPTGKRCVLSHAIVVAAGDAGGTTTVSIGQNTAETDFIPANTLSNLDAEYDSVILQPIPNTTPLKIKSYVAATVIEAQVASQSGMAGNTIYLFGILY